MQLYSRLHGCCCCFVRRRRCGVRSVVVHLRVRSGLVSALLRRVGPWDRWSVWSLRLSGRWRLRWREGVRVVSCGHRDQLRGVRQRSGGGARVIGSASRCALEGLGHRHLPLRRSDRSRRRCLRRGRGHPRQCGRGGGGIVVGTGGVGASVGVGDSLVAPSGSSSSHWRCRLLCCSVVRSGACRCNWLTVVAVDVCPAAVAAGDVAAVAAAADPPLGVFALRVTRAGARGK